MALARARRQGSYLGLFNAVLRKIAADGSRLTKRQDAPRLNTPEWLWESWSAAYGEAACRRIATAHLDEPPLDLTALGDPAGTATALGGTKLPTGTVRLSRAGGITELPGFAEGRWWVQDAAAALPMRLLGDVSGKCVVDLCAAPGGKTAQLAAAGARVTAVDRSEPRLARLRENLSRLGLSANTAHADAAAWRPNEPADAVLVDAPCSATGTIRRHPDVARIKSQRDVAALLPVQQQLLAAAADMVKPGGAVVYCVCSLQPEEGPEQIGALGQSGIDLVRDAVPPDAFEGAAEFISSDGDLRTFPDQWSDAGGLDGFFAARLRRP